MVANFKNFWKNKTVLITGHTGFKGAWLTFWLKHLGADITGISLEPETKPSIFEQLNLESEINHHIQDIRDREYLNMLLKKVQPDVIIHLAAQSLVRRSYQEPVYTWETNVLGTINLLDSLRMLKKECAIVIVTTDKVYDNKEWEFRYRETDRLGGKDPYSSSKAAAELAVYAWRASFFKDKNKYPAYLASARAGNVIGGGDWAEDRIIPDIVRAFKDKNPVEVRSPDAIRPWQHVLEPLYGYLILSQTLLEKKEASFEKPFNFGPADDANKQVRELIHEVQNYWKGEWIDISSEDDLPESHVLQISNARAKNKLSWSPTWDFKKTVKKTIDWYKSTVSNDGANIRNLCLGDIQAFMDDLL